MARPAFARMMFDDFRQMESVALAEAFPRIYFNFTFAESFMDAIGTLGSDQAIVLARRCLQA